MNFKIREDHLLTLADFMERHPEFATGRLSSANAREKFKKLWGDLTIQLNSLGFGERPTEKWQKTWTDYKSNLKKKASEIRRAQSMTGGGPEYEKKLSDIESRILKIFGETFVKGCGVEEKGLTHINPNEITNKDISVRIDMPSASSSQKDDIIADHDYLAMKSTPRKRKWDPESADDLYKKTLECLTSIEATIGNRLSDMTEMLERKLTELTNVVRDNVKQLKQDP